MKNDLPLRFHSAKLTQKLSNSKFFSCIISAVSSVTLTANVLQLPEGGDFGALHCQPSTHFDRSTKLDLTTEPPLLGRCC